MWLLVLELRTPTRAASALNLAVLSSPPHNFRRHFYFVYMCGFVCVDQGHLSVLCYVEFGESYLYLLGSLS